MDELDKVLEELRTKPLVDDPDYHPDIIELDADGNVVERHPTSLSDDLAALNEQD